MSELVRDWKAEKKDLEEAFDIIADKLVKADAEIERLKALIYEMADRTVFQEALIDDLRDALENHNLDHLQDDLIRRAREATR